MPIGKNYFTFYFQTEIVPDCMKEAKMSKITSMLQAQLWAVIWSPIRRIFPFVHNIKFISPFNHSIPNSILPRPRALALYAALTFCFESPLKSI